MPVGLSNIVWPFPQGIGDFPSGAVGIWFPRNYVGGPRRTISNSVTNGQTDANLLYAPRRGFTLYNASNLTITDANATAPDGTGDASTITSGASVNWSLSQTISALPVGTYTLALSVKYLGGASANFKLGLNSALSTLTATNSWQRFIATFTQVSIGSATIQMSTPDGVLAANFAVCDFQLFLGTQDKNTNALTQAPLSVQNSDWIVGLSQFDSSSAVVGNTWLSGGTGFTQFPSTKNSIPFTIVYLAKRATDTSGAGADPIVAKPNINSATWQDFMTGPFSNFLVGTYISANIDKTADGITQSSENIWAAVGGAPRCYVHRYDGTTATAFVDACKMLNNVVTVSNTTFSELYIGFRGPATAGGCNIYGLAYYARSLSDAEVLQATSAMYARLPDIAPFRSIIFEGTSITAGTGGFPYSYLCPPNLVPSVGGANYAIGGSSLGSLVSRASGVDAALALTFPHVCVLSVEVGANDLGLGRTYNNNPNGFTTALASYLDARRAAGWKVVVHTVLARLDDSDGGAQFNADRHTANATIRGWGNSHYDALSDWANDPTMGTDVAPNNTTNFNADKVHPTSAGHVILEPITRSAINSITP